VDHFDHLFDEFDQQLYKPEFALENIYTFTSEMKALYDLIPALPEDVLKQKEDLKSLKAAKTEQEKLEKEMSQNSSTLITSVSKITAA
jgi:cell shape-determining protein MreC